MVSWSRLWERTVILGFAHYFATPFSTVKRQFDRLDRWTRKRLRCMKFKRISKLDNWRLRNKYLTRMGLVSLYSLVSQDTRDFPYVGQGIGGRPVRESRTPVNMGN